MWRVRTKPGSRGGTHVTAPRLSVREILHPRAVAVFGASEDREKFGGRIIHFLLKHGFTGRIVPINPRRKEILGQTAYAALADAPPGVEVAILAIPTNQLLTAIQQCADAGVGCSVIIATGFAEANEAGAELQRRILDIATPVGMRIVGPNCMGLINPGGQLALCSSVVLDTEKLLIGRIGLVSQSGALMVSLVDLVQRATVSASVPARRSAISRTWRSATSWNTSLPIQQPMRYVCISRGYAIPSALDARSARAVASANQWWW
jgi:acetyl-CoA synthetase (ADP-forming)